MRKEIKAKWSYKKLKQYYVECQQGITEIFVESRGDNDVIISQLLYNSTGQDEYDKLMLILDDQCNKRYIFGKLSMDNIIDIYISDGHDNFLKAKLIFDIMSKYDVFKANTGNIRNALETSNIKLIKYIMEFVDNNAHIKISNLVIIKHIRNCRHDILKLMLDCEKAGKIDIVFSKYILDYIIDRKTYNDITNIWHCIKLFIDHHFNYRRFINFDEVFQLIIKKNMLNILGLFLESYAKDLKKDIERTSFYLPSRVTRKKMMKMFSDYDIEVKIDHNDR